MPFKDKPKDIKHRILILHPSNWQKNIKRQPSLDSYLHLQLGKVEDKSESINSNPYVDAAISVPIIKKYNCFIVFNHQKIKHTNSVKMLHYSSLSSNHSYCSLFYIP